MIGSQCIRCVNMLDNAACIAFPDGIPEEILSGHFDHTNEYPGDGGITFQGVSKQDVKLNYKCPENPPGSGNFKCDDSDAEGGSSDGDSKKEKKPGKRSAGSKNPSGYVPLKTRDEAEEYAKSNLLDPANVKRIEEWNKGPNHKQYSLIKYRGLSMDIANEVNQAVLENIQMGIKPLKSIESKSFKGKQFGARISTSGGLELNTTNIGSKEKLAKHIETESKMFGDFGRGLMADLESRQDIMNDEQKAKFEDFKELFKYKRYVSSYDTKSTIDHEMMHHFLETGGGDYRSPEREEFNNEWRAAAKASLDSDWKYQISAYGAGAHSPGNRFALYGFDKAKEHMCESYAIWRQGGDVHPDVASFFEKRLSGASKRDDFVSERSSETPEPPKPKRKRKTKVAAERQMVVGRMEKVTGATDINLDRININDAKVIADTLDAESKFIPLKLSKISNSSGVRGAWMTMTPAGELGISATHLKSQADRKLASWDDYINLYGEAVESLEKQRSGPDVDANLKYRITRTISDYNFEKRKYERKRDSGTAFVPKAVPYMFEGDDRTRAVLTHEVGHDRWNHVLSDADKKEIGDAFKSAYKRGDRVSDNGMENSEEWWCEQYSMHRMGKESDPVVKKIINQVRGDRK